MALRRLFFTGKDYKYSKVETPSTSGIDNTDFALEEFSHSSSEDELYSVTTINESKSSSTHRKAKIFEDSPINNGVDIVDMENNVETYEIDINGADGPQNLQSIALKYNCSVWELKRVNNLVNNADFHALRTIKVIAMKNSYRSELLHRHGRLLNEEECDVSSSNRKHETIVEGQGDSCEDLDAEKKSKENVRHISIRQTMTQDCETGSSFLLSMDADLQRIRESVVNQKSSLDEVTNSLTQPRIIPFSHFVRGKHWQFSDSLTLKNLLLVAVFFIVVIPVAGLGIYFYSNYIAN